MGTIFINYRREETAGEARAVFADLNRILAAGSVFMDVEGIGPGLDFREVLQHKLASVDMMLALIGRGWLDLRDGDGRRRLDDPEDLVRAEIRMALEREISVTPVLLQGAAMPRERDLPDDIRSLAFRNAFEIRHTRWSSDVRDLIQGLGLVQQASPAAEAGSTLAPIAPLVQSAGKRRRWFIGAGAATVATVAAGIGWYRSRPSTAQQASATTTPPLTPSGPANREDIAGVAQFSTGGASGSRIGSGINLGDDALSRLDQQQRVAMALLDHDRPAAIAAIDRNLREVDIALKSFPDNAQLHALAGYAAKNAYANSKRLVDPSRREVYLTLAERHFRRALELSHDDPSAINGLGNVRFYQHRFDEAITLHKRALSLTENTYPDAQNDLRLVQLAKLGKVPVDP